MCLVYPMLPVPLDCSFTLRLRYSLTCICPVSCVSYVASFSGLSFTKRQSTLPFRGIYVVGIETGICIYGKLLFPKQSVHPFFGEPENNLLSLER